MTDEEYKQKVVQYIEDRETGYRWGCYISLLVFIIGPVAIGVIGFFVLFDPLF